ncbi:unnamed protein product, partial [Dovyalis caffra]
MGWLIGSRVANGHKLIGLWPANGQVDITLNMLGSSDAEVASSTYPESSPDIGYNYCRLFIKHASEHKDEEKSNEAK